MKALILRTFNYATNAAGTEHARVRKGDIVDLPEDICKSMFEAGYVADPDSAMPESKAVSDAPENKMSDGADENKGAANVDLDMAKGRYKEATGRAAHHTWSQEVIEEKLEALDE